jgi:tetratricopeptide (TPR) repeat protein
MPATKQAKAKPVKDPMLNKAQEQLKAGNIEDAKATLGKVVEKNPSSAAGHMSLGLLNLRDGDLDAADQSFDAALAVDSSNAKALSYKAGIASKRGNVDKAIALHKEALAANPTHNQSRMSIGSLQAGQKNFKEAEEALSEAIRYNPQHAMAYLLYGRVLHQQGRTEEAVASMNKMLVRQPDSALAHGLMGRFHQSIGDTASAISSFEKSLELNPDVASTHENLGNSLMSTEQYSGAVRAYETALELNPENDTVQLRLAKALVETGDHSKARAMLQKMSMGGKMQSRAHMMLADIHARKSEYGEALDEYEAAMLNSPLPAEKAPDIQAIRKKKGTDESKVAAFKEAIAKMDKENQAAEEFAVEEES